ncbi:arginine-tRNA-protein transferase 1 [Panaeolus papilionaceus]|nr:arginine-tRNA-protein transferase 1 [Panaeolus papilionaceus]
MSSIKNCAIPYGSGASTCGYCSPSGKRSESSSNMKEASLEAIVLECKTYQAMIDHGWRRSGAYCYKPDLRTTCCPQYTIKLDADNFKPSRSQRQLINRWNRYILQGEPEHNMEVDSAQDAGTSKYKPKKTKEVKGPVFTTLANALHSSEHSFLSSEQRSVHRFEIQLERSSLTQEKFDLYEKYQEDIHNDQHNTPNGFKRFLVDSPLSYERIPYASTPLPHLPADYGSYHQLYRVDGQLVAIAVLDILPKCVSSVYFMYDKSWERFSMGKLSALREVSLAQEMKAAGAPEMEALYMGYYIHSCPKMKYKGEYSPSFLVDPETYEWYPLEKCIPLLDKNRYACFSDPSHSIPADVDTDDLEDNSSDTPLSLFEGVEALARDQSGNVVTRPIQQTKYLSLSRVREGLGECVKGLGPEVSKVIAFAL